MKNLLLSVYDGLFKNDNLHNIMHTMFLIVNLAYFMIMKPQVIFYAMLSLVISRIVNRISTNSFPSLYGQYYIKAILNNMP